MKGGVTINKLYSTDCPKCKQLKKILNDNGIPYEEINDKSIMIEKGFNKVPIFEIEERIMDYEQTKKWIGENI